MQGENIVNRYRQFNLSKIRPLLLCVCLTRALIMRYALLSVENEVGSSVHLA